METGFVPDQDFHGHEAGRVIIIHSSCLDLFCFAYLCGADEAVRWSSNPRARPSAVRQRMLAVDIVPGQLLRLAPPDLLSQVFHDLEPRSLKGVVECRRVNVGAGHGQMHDRAKAGCGVPMLFQRHSGLADGDEAVQTFNLLFQPGAQVGVVVEAANSELDFHR